MKLQDLKKPLTVKDIDFRVGEVYKDYNGDVYCTVLAYKDARVDMERLDEVCGQGNWQNEYHRDSKGNLQCGIGIWYTEHNGWVWKYSNGTESTYEKEKGEYSDAFKRAGFMWGIGRQLYDFPRIKIYLNEKEHYESGGKTKARFNPNNLKWEVSEDYQTVRAVQMWGNTAKTRVNIKDGKTQAK